MAFQTKVTSQALVACSRHERKAETAFPPTTQQRLSSRFISSGVGGKGKQEQRRGESRNPMVHRQYLLEAGKGRISNCHAHLRGYAIEVEKVPLCVGAPSRLVEIMNRRPEKARPEGASRSPTGAGVIMCVGFPNKSSYFRTNTNFYPAELWYR